MPRRCLGWRRPATVDWCSWFGCWPQTVQALLCGEMLLVPRSAGESEGGLKEGFGREATPLNGTEMLLGGCAADRHSNYWRAWCVVVHSTTVTSHDAGTARGRSGNPAQCALRCCSQPWRCTRLSRRRPAQLCDENLYTTGILLQIEQRRRVATKQAVSERCTWASLLAVPRVAVRADPQMKKYRSVSLAPWARGFLKGRGLIEQEKRQPVGKRIGFLVDANMKLLPRVSRQAELKQGGTRVAALG